MTDTLSIDFYGTLDKNPELWQNFMLLMRAQDTSVCVISGPPKENIEKGLEHLGFIHGVHYGRACSIISDLMAGGNHCWFDEDHDGWYSSEGLWWQHKAIICDRLGISTHIDSDARFGKFFAYIPTRFIHADRTFLIQVRRMVIEMGLESEDQDDDDGYASMYGGGEGGI